MRDHHHHHDGGRDSAVMDKPAHKLDAARGNRCTPPGIKICTINLNTIDVGNPIEIFKGGAYGFSVLSITNLSTYITNGETFKIKFARLRQRIASGSMSFSNDDEAITVTPGLVWIPSNDEMIFDELWGILSGSNQSVVVTIAIALKPGALLSQIPAIITDSSGFVMDLQNADADADFTYVLRGPVTNSRMAAYRASTADWTRAQSESPSAQNSRSHTSDNWLLANSATFGRDTSDNSMRLIESRSFTGGDTSVAATHYGLLVNSRNTVFEPVFGDWRRMSGYRDDATSTGAHLGVVQSRMAGYGSSLRGRRFTCKSTGITGVAAGTALTTTAPTFLLVAGATVELIIRRIIVSLPLIGTSTTFRALVKTDTADRFSSGGTARAPQTLNNGNVVATTVARNLEAPTATAEGGGTRDVWVESGQITSGSTIKMEFMDGIIIVAGGSLLLYVFTATAGATVDYMIEFEEANVE